MKDNIKVIEYSVDISGIKATYIAMYNSTVISEEEVRKLLMTGMAEYDNRVVIMNKSQYEYLIKA